MYIVYGYRSPNSCPRGNNNIIADSCILNRIDPIIFRTYLRVWSSLLVLVDMYRSTSVVFEGSKARWIVGRLIDVNIVRRLKFEETRAYTNWT